MPAPRKPADQSALDRIVAEARRERDRRADSYRERALKLFAHVCARCGRDFSGVRLRELTVHHKDHDHHNNPPDGSNWELLCVYCHDDEHSRETEARTGIEGRNEAGAAATHQPFSELKRMLERPGED